MSKNPLFGKFEVIECFKKDESLAVYLADHVYLNKKIILKTLNTGTISDQVVLERFKREARLLAKISHPNIISVYDFGTFDEFFYISFEYFEGKNLRQAFGNNSWRIEDKIDIMNQVASGLSETHRMKVIHRDLKPENILINDKNEVKIADFGLAQVSGGEKLTAAEAIVGTPAYMTPEQINGLDSDERSDLFSFGILIYELFFGVNPFLGKDAGQTLNNIQSCRINTPPPHQGMPEYIPLIIDTLLKKNKSDRPRSADFIFDYTGKVVQSESSGKKHSGRYIAAMIIVSGLVALFFYNQGVFDTEQPQLTENEIRHDTMKTVIPARDSMQTILSSPQPEKQNRPSGFNPDPLTRQAKTADSVSELTSAPITEVYGYINIKCKPWANIYLDSLFIDTTPVKNPFRLLSGEHIIQLVHPDFPEYRSKVSVPENDTIQININLENLAGYLICNVFPWGDIYINDDFKGQTPLNKPLILEPGNHVLEIKNPGYATEKSEIYIERSDTLKMTIKLKALVKSN